jgi:hypothetical protein
VRVKELVCPLEDSEAVCENGDGEEKEDEPEKNRLEFEGEKAAEVEYGEVEDEKEGLDGDSDCSFDSLLTSFFSSIPNMCIPSPTLNNSFDNLFASLSFTSFSLSIPSSEKNTAIMRLADKYILLLG